MKYIYLTFIFAAFQTNLFADQCAWNDDAIALRGSRIMKGLATINNQKPSVYHFCEPCNDETVKRVVVKEINGEPQIKVGDVRKEGSWTADVEPRTYWEVEYTDTEGKLQTTDLAYIFVKTSVADIDVAGNEETEKVDRLANVAGIANCEAHDVSSVVYAYDRAKGQANGAELEVIKKQKLVDVPLAE